MNTPAHLKHIARHIHETLNNGFVLNNHAIHFLQSTYSISTREDLHAFFDDGDENGIETILDLVVSPDLAFMRDVEPFLMGHRFNQEDEALLGHAMLRLNVRTGITFPDNPQSIECDVPGDVMLRFVKKLKISFSLPDPLIESMKMYVSETALPFARVLIRQSGLSWDKDLTDFFSLFFRYSGQNDDVLLSDLEWVLGVLSGPPGGKGIQDRLIDCLHDYQKRMEDIKTIDDMLSKNTMETLMLQGVRVPSISVDTLRIRIVTVRRILATVYTWVEGPEMAPSSIDYGDCVGQDGIQKIVKLLS